MNETVLIALIGFAAGTAGSFIGPSVRWWLEKRKLRHEDRRDQIDQWEVMLRKVSEPSVPYQKFADFENNLRSKRRFPSLELALGPSRVREILQRTNDPESAGSELKLAVADLQVKWGLL